MKARAKSQTISTRTNIENAQGQSIRSKLLPQRRLDDRLLSMTSEEGGDAVKEQRCETGQGVHGERDPAQYLGLERV